MKHRLSPLLILTLAIFIQGCGEGPKPIENQVVEVSCGLCQFKQQQQGCLINIRLNEKVLPVVGGPNLSMEEMHQPGGYCVTIRLARVSGEVDADRFLASSYELLPLKENTPSLPAGH